MTGRAQRSRGKHSPRSKKRRGKRSHPSIVSGQQPASLTNEATVPPQVVTPTINLVAQVPTTVKNPNLLIELRRVGILGGIMLAILLVLALVLG